MGLGSVEASNPASYFNFQAHTHTDNQANQTKAKWYINQLVSQDSIETCTHKFTPPVVSSTHINTDVTNLVDASRQVASETKLFIHSWENTPKTCQATQTNMVDHSSSSSISTAIYEEAPNERRKHCLSSSLSIQHQINLQRVIQHQYAEQEMKLTWNKLLQIIKGRKMLDHACTYQEKKEASSK